MHDDDNDNENGENGDGPGEMPGFAGPFPIPGGLLAGLFGGDNGQKAKEQAEAVAKITRGLGGKAAARGFVDQLRTDLAGRYVPHTWVNKLKGFREAVGDEVFKLIATGPGLKDAMDEWAGDRVREILTFVADATLERLAARSDEALPNRHEVEAWATKTMCFCGQCWKD